VRRLHRILVLRDHVAHCVEHAINSGNKAEQRLMISEKTKAATDAQSAIAKSIMTGTGDRAHSKVVKLYRGRVRSNLKRLARGG
jgi:hypothetical protein